MRWWCSHCEDYSPAVRVDTGFICCHTCGRVHVEDIYFTRPSFTEDGSDQADHESTGKLKEEQDTADSGVKNNEAIDLVVTENSENPGGAYEDIKFGEIYDSSDEDEDDNLFLQLLKNNF